MPFNTRDRDLIRDYLGYPWSENDWLMDALKDAVLDHGESVVSYVRERLDKLQELVPVSLDQSNSGQIATEIDVYQEISIKMDVSRSASQGQGLIQQLINEIAGAIGITQNPTPLLRS